MTFKININIKLYQPLNQYDTDINLNKAQIQIEIKAITNKSQLSIKSSNLSII